MAINIGSEARTLPLDGPGPRLLLASEEKVSLGTGGVELVPDSAAVVSFEAVS
ncbi:MAG: hypothetical protein ACYCS2_02505 [Acidimicrobiales bacterium]